jgi:cell division protein FtsW
MTDQSHSPQFIDDDERSVRPVRGKSPTGWASEPLRPAAERKLTRWRTLDKSLLIVVGMLLILGSIMVFSATFDWSLIEFGSETTVLESHLFNISVGLVAMMIFAVMSPHVTRRLAVIIMLMAISFLIAVLIFGDQTFGARRALINGRFQPGEFSELATIIYMAAWLGSKKTRVRSVTYGLIPFIVLISIVTGLVVIQPDLSTAVVIIITSGLMFFLAGADMRQIFFSIFMVVTMGVISVTLHLMPAYAVDRVNTYLAGIDDIMQASYHAVQARISLTYGSWVGMGLGQSEGKFLHLPAPHTDSIFAVIGEELGVMGIIVILLLYSGFSYRGFQIARSAKDAFGALLASGITIWVAAKAILNIAVMTGYLPPSGLPLPFISFGGSSLVVLLVGVGLLLSIHREAMLWQGTPERRESTFANYDRGRRDRRARVPRARRSRSGTESSS